MCWSEKCCFCFRLDLGCIFIGVISLILSIITASTSLLYLTLDNGDEFQKHYQVHHLLGLAHLDVNHTSHNMIFGIILCIAVLWAVSSLALLIGVKMNVSGYVLSFFAFGIFITFCGFLSSLLFLLRSLWVPAFLLLGVFLIYVHFLVVVHTYYELQVQGKITMAANEDHDDEILLQA